MNVPLRYHMFTGKSTTFLFISFLASTVNTTTALYRYCTRAPAERFIGNF